MASTQKKSGAAAAKKPSSAAKTGSRKSSGAAPRNKKAPPQSQPIRREVWGGVLLVLMLCTAVSYFGVSAIFIDWLAAALKGLVGYGYYLAAPAMALAGLNLLFHHGRPVRLRTACALLSPVLLGSLAHLLLCKETFDSLTSILPRLWRSGQTISSGGVVSGLLAEGAAAVFSPVVSGVVFFALLVALLVVSLQVTLRALAQRHRGRVRYEAEEEEDLPPAPREPERRRDTARARIDLPLDDEETDFPASPVTAQSKKNAEGRAGGFFRRKSDHQKTPDQVLSEHTDDLPPAIPAEKAAQSTFAPAPREDDPFASTPAPAPAPAPMPIQSPAPAPAAEKSVPQPMSAEEPSTRREKAKTAKEVAAQTAAVTE
ncbi:MAG: DNA translocase FtsK, partial [Oscillospiraceae bacterium]|nr:DNA translocase FtsK [Oscillospiraceae bacterium]